MAKKTVQFSIDLVEAALKHRQFLQLVDAYPSLYGGPHVQNAIRRYNTYIPTNIPYLKWTKRHD